ncbi:retrovirus-related Pol polyprotein from transposon 412 [Trichonephila clavipes]|nr:retrovirus-related Pol polyprotein from transposon 412 [Trichonephila clavipes]
MEATTQASRRDRQSTRGAGVTLDAPCESPWKSDIEKLRDEFQALKDHRQNQEKRNFKCCGCGITAVKGGDKGLYVIGQINNISCRMVLDTGANVSIIRKDLAQNSHVSIICTPPCVSLQTVTGDKIQVHGKANISLRFGNIDYHHTAYIADITDPCILGLEFLKNNNFKLDFENSNMHSKLEAFKLNWNPKLVLAYKLNWNPTKKL